MNAVEFAKALQEMLFCILLENKMHDAEDSINESAMALVLLQFGVQFCSMCDEDKDDWDDVARGLVNYCIKVVKQVKADERAPV